jgi:hypothetical protein
MHASADLTPRQSKFVANFLVTGNGTQAAMAAGYSQVSARVGAHRLLTKAAVRAAIAAAQALDSKRLQIERQDVISGLLEAVEMARAQMNPAGLISAWTAISKTLGLAVPERRQVEVTSVTAQTERARLEAMSDEELMAMLQSSSA